MSLEVAQGCRPGALQQVGGYLGYSGRDADALSSACDHCYAETWAKRAGHAELWNGERRRTTGTNWQRPIKWNRQAAAAGKRARVFCASLADVFDNQVPRRWRDDLWHRIDQTPHLDWLLLTKHPQNIAKMLPDPETGVTPWGNGWPNVWLGVSAGNQEEADRNLPILGATPAPVCWQHPAGTALSRWRRLQIQGTRRRSIRSSCTLSPFPRGRMRRCLPKCRNWWFRR
jgi:hypothetical protein